MKNWIAMSMVALSAVALAAPPGGRHERGDEDEGGPDRMENAARRNRMMYVVAIAEALELNEADALKLSEKIKGLDEKRAPIRKAMHEAMKAVKAAADGDAAALTQVDANVQKVLDGRAQMAAMDKDLFVALSKDLAPQKKAKLALALAKMGQLRKGRFGRR